VSASENLNVIRYSEGQYWLWRTGAAEPLAVSAADVPLGCWFAAPGDQVRLTTAQVTPSEVKHFRSSLPYLLEESIIDDVDDIHFASAAIGDGCYGIGMVHHQLMAEWLTQLGEQAPQKWVSEALMLPWRRGECCLLFEGDRVTVRWGECDGATVSIDLLATLLSVLPMAERWVAYGTDRDQAMAVLPSTIAEHLEWRAGGFGSALMLIDSEAPILNLREGAFAPRLPLARWWQSWRTVALVAAVVLLLQISSDYLQYRQLSSENLQLREAMLSSYRRANPSGAVVDMEKQLDRQLAAFGGEAGQRFTPVLVAVVSAVAEGDGRKLTNLNYGVSGELRLNLLAPSFESVESLRLRLEAEGFEATLENSSMRGDQVQARLRIEVSG
jgi:general secretion pathway protein L